MAPPVSTETGAESIRALVDAGLLPTVHVVLRDEGMACANRFLHQEPTPEALRAALGTIKVWGSCSLMELIGGLAVAARDSACPIHACVRKSAIEKLAKDRGLPADTVFYLAGVGIAWEATMRGFVTQDGDSVFVTT